MGLRLRQPGFTNEGLATATVPKFPHVTLSAWRTQKSPGRITHSTRGGDASTFHRRAIIATRNDLRTGECMGRKTCGERMRFAARPVKSNGKNRAAGTERQDAREFGFACFAAVCAM